MLRLYSILIWIYGWLVLFASPFSSKAKLWIEGRKDQKNRIKDLLKPYPKNQKYVWIHSASYGEYEMSKPIYKGLKAQHSDLIYIFSFFSPSGYEDAVVDSEDSLKIYLPQDLTKKIEPILDFINPSFVIFIKYDFWFNFLTALKYREIPYFFTSINLNPESYLFWKISMPLLNKIAGAQNLYCHNSDAVETLKAHGIYNCTLLGDTRIEQVLENQSQVIKTLHWSHNNPIIIYGSVCPEDENMVFSFVNNHPHLNHIIAPHSIKPEYLENMEKQLSGKIVRYSKENHHISSNLLIVDTMGDLRYLYRNSHAAYVGGGFSRGPHNLLEPLIYGVPSSCGPVVEKYPMAKELENFQLVKIFSDQKRFDRVIHELLEINLADFNEKAMTFIRERKSRLETLFSELNQIIEVQK